MKVDSIIPFMLRQKPPCGNSLSTENLGQFRHAQMQFPKCGRKMGLVDCDFVTFSLSCTTIFIMTTLCFTFTYARRNGNIPEEIYLKRLE